MLSRPHLRAGCQAEGPLRKGKWAKQVSAWRGAAVRTEGPAGKGEVCKQVRAGAVLP